MVHRGGVLVPLYMREAMRLNFRSDQPVAVQIGAGECCVVSGRRLDHRLRRKPQNYVVVTGQARLDGYTTGAAEVRQFVAESTGSLLSSETQLTERNSARGIQIQVWHLTPEAWTRWAAERSPSPVSALGSSVGASIPDAKAVGLSERIQHENYPDVFSARDWQSTPTAKVWIHMVSATAWRSITREVPPPTPVNPDHYIRAGLPWFDRYDADRSDLPTPAELAGLGGVGEFSEADDDTPIVSRQGAGINGDRDRRPQPVQPGDWKWC